MGWSWASAHEARSAAGAGVQVAVAAVGRFSCSPGWLASRAPERQAVAVEVRAAEAEAQLPCGV